jgi:hypothetical protein
MHLSSTDPNTSPRKRGSNHNSMFMRQLSSLKTDELVLPGLAISDDKTASGSNKYINSPLKVGNTVPTSPKNKIRPTGRLKGVIKSMQMANAFSSHIKEQVEDKKLIHADVLPPPACLKKFLNKGGQKKTDNEVYNQIKEEEQK